MNLTNTFNDFLLYLGDVWGWIVALMVYVFLVVLIIHPLDKLFGVKDGKGVAMVLVMAAMIEYALYKLLIFV